jgi:hypothetical protein
MKAALFFSLFAALSVVMHGRAEMLPPGTYHDSGRVVEMADGEFGLFRSGGAYLFPRPLQEKLRPYLRQFVRVDYTRTGSIRMDMSPIVRIDQVTPYAASPEALPVIVSVKPTQAAYGYDQPVTVLVTVENRGQISQTLALGNCFTSLCQDYQQKKTLEPVDQYALPYPYGLGDRILEVPPGGKIEFTVTSSRLIPPGAYQIVLDIPLSGTDFSESEFVPVMVRAPVGEADTKAALKEWMTQAALEDKVEIAVKLLKLGDTGGRDEVLDLLQSGAYTPHAGWGYGWSVLFAFKYGGERGDRLALEVINAQKTGSSVESLIEGVEYSPRRLNVLETLLNDDKSVEPMNSDSTVRPRICDITAAWLAGYSNGRIKFPMDGTEHARDTAVESIKSLLKTDPLSLEVLNRPPATFAANEDF